MKNNKKTSMSNESKGNEAEIQEMLEEEVTLLEESGMMPELGEEEKDCMKMELSKLEYAFRLSEKVINKRKAAQKNQEKIQKESFNNEPQEET